MPLANSTVTQKDIAKRVGVTQQSVALALKGHRSVSAEMRRQIEETARDLGYDRLGNAGARALSARRHGKHIKTGVIAVALTPEHGPMRGEPFFLSILQGIEQYAGGLGIDIYLWYQVIGRPVPRLIREGGVDGIICLMSEALDLLPDSLLPTVFFIHGSGHVIGIDDTESTRLAVRHLAHLGHRRIAYLGWNNATLTGVDRHEGFRLSMAECGLAVHGELIDTTLCQFHMAPKSVESLVNAGGFTALVCYNDLVAMEAVRTLNRLGLRVPEDVSVVGVDDISVECGFQPALTSISYDRVAMGARAATIVDESADHLVAQRRAADSKPPPMHEKFPVRLIERGSTRPLQV